MPRSGAGVYTLPPGTAAAPGELATAEQFNDRFNDVAADLNFLFGQATVAMPVGGIIMWSGSAIPTGWRLCDGTNGTPDLRNRFIVGSGSTYAVGNTGGADNVALEVNQLPSHTHAAGTLGTGAAGDHVHGLSGTALSGGAAFSFASRRRDGTLSLFSSPSGISVAEFGAGVSQSRVGGGSGDSTADLVSYSGQHTHSLSGTANNAGAHTHAVTGATAAAGTGAAHENRPPYYALAFIMRVA